MVLWGAGLLLVLAALSGAAAWYMLGVPGQSYSGPTAAGHARPSRIWRSD